MSNILAIDCCLKITGLALMIDDCVIDSISEDLGRLQSRKLPLLTEEILSRNKLSWSDINYIALTNGPGYFTGIRVGAAYATGLAYACGVKIIPVSSLEMLACSINDPSQPSLNRDGVSKSPLIRGDLGGLQEKVLALVYAGHGFVYASSKNFLSEGEYSLEQIRSWLEKNPDAKIISDDPDKTGLEGFDILTIRPDVKSLCMIAGEKKNLAVSPLELKISYYRAPQGVN